MTDDIQRILNGIQEIYKQIKMINLRLDHQQPPIVIETPAVQPKRYQDSRYPGKSISESQLNSLENKILKFKAASEKANILTEFGVDQLDQLTSSQAREIISRYWGNKPNDRT